MEEVIGVLTKKARCPGLVVVSLRNVAREQNTLATRLEEY